MGLVLVIYSSIILGITSKGFRSIGVGSFGNWNKFKDVQVFLENDVKVSYISRNSFEDIHYYNKEDYD
jgi:hypothetical protein